MDGVRILLVEDDGNLAHGMTAALTQTGYLVQAVRTAKEALHLARTAEFALGILDLGLPDGDGIDLLREMRHAGAGFPILILSARDGLNDRIRGLDTGADDYLVKPFALGELEARLRALGRRRAERASVLQVGGLRFEADAKRALIGRDPIDLTARELAILVALLAKMHKVVPKQALFDAVFPLDTEAAPNALEVHVSRLRHKLKPARVTIRSLRGLGYRLEECSNDDGVHP